MIIYIILIILIILILFRIIYELKHFRVVKYTINTDKINYDRSFVFLSDLHCNTFGRNNYRLIKKIYSLNPDFILTGGDMLVGAPDYSPQKAIELFDNLAKDYPIYSANGNHECRLKSRPDKFGNSYIEYADSLIKNEITLIENDSVYISKSNVKIYGLEIDKKYYKKREKSIMSEDYVEKLLGKADPSEFNILLAHNPIYFENYCKWSPDLILSGHEHGGTIRMPGFGGIISTQWKMFPRYDKGFFENGDTKMIISAGLGTHTINVRLFNRPELIYIELKKTKSEV